MDPEQLQLLTDMENFRVEREESTGHAKGKCSRQYNKLFKVAMDKGYIAKDTRQFTERAGLPAVEKRATAPDLVRRAQEQITAAREMASRPRKRSKPSKPSKSSKSSKPDGDMQDTNLSNAYVGNSDSDSPLPDIPINDLYFGESHSNQLQHSSYVPRLQRDEDEDEDEEDSIPIYQRRRPKDKVEDDNFEVEDDNFEGEDDNLEGEGDNLEVEGDNFEDEGDNFEDEESPTTRLHRPETQSEYNFEEDDDLADTSD